MAKTKTIGYDYYVGVHFVMCHGPVDYLLRIRVDEKDATFSTFLPGHYLINVQGLFGGREREGGLLGYFDYEDGSPDQGQNAYLLEHIGGLIPAYRGVAGVVLNHMNMGMNPYLKPWAFTLQRIHVCSDGVPQWYDEKAEIRVSGGSKQPQNIFFAIETSIAMSRSVSGETNRLDLVKRDVNLALDWINQWRKENKQSPMIAVCGWEATPIVKTWSGTSDAIFQEIQGYVNSLGGTTYEGSIDYVPLFQEAMKWFEFYGMLAYPPKNTFVFLTSGHAAPMDSVPNAVELAYDMIHRTGRWAVPWDVDICAIGIDVAGDVMTSLYNPKQVDNTPHDSVPDITIDDDNALLDAIYYAMIRTTAAMNPAHIIRECLTDKTWGMGYLATDIDEMAFTYAADKLYEEGLGISIIWDAESTIEDFIKIILKHIDASIFVDRRTGQFVLKLIRDDYDSSTLLVLDPSNVLSVADFSKVAFGELVNSVTVTYPDERKGPATISVQDIALAQQQQAVINVSVNYDGFTDPTNASKCAQRDLRVLSTPLISCTIITNRIAENLNLGSVFKLSWPDFDLAEAVMRVTAITFGDGKNNRIRISCVQDVFAFPENAFIIPPAEGWVDPAEQPAVITQRAVYEVPYLQIVQEVGQTAIDAILSATNNPDAGYVGAAAVRPSSGQISAQIWTDAGAGYKNVSGLDYCPCATLNQDIDRMVTTFSIINIKDAININLGTWVQVGAHELMSVTAITADSITVKRAVLDTVPLNHVKGESLIFWDNISDSDPTEYVASDVVKVKLASVSSYGIVPIPTLPEDTVTLRSRAIRPYPPANVKVNGFYYPSIALSSVVLTWVARNRTQQTGTDLLGFTDAGITPEPETTYHVVLRGQLNQIVHDMPGITALTYTIPTAALTAAGSTGVIELTSVRDGYESYYYHNIPIFIGSPSENSLLFIHDQTSASVDGGDLNFVVT